MQHIFIVCDTTINTIVTRNVRFIFSLKYCLFINSQMCIKHLWDKEKGDLLKEVQIV